MVHKVLVLTGHIIRPWLLNFSFIRRKGMVKSKNNVIKSVFYFLMQEFWKSFWKFSGNILQITESRKKIETAGHGIRVILPIGKCQIPIINSVGEAFCPQTSTREGIYSIIPKKRTFWGGPLASCWHLWTKSLPYTTIIIMSRYRYDPYISQIVPTRRGQIPFDYGTGPLSTEKRNKRSSVYGLIQTKPKKLFTVFT